MKSTNSIAGAELSKSLQHIKKLETKHRALDHHWSGLGADPRQSDHLFKHHIMRLRHIYKHHVSHDVTVEPNTAVEDRARLHMSPVTKLYGKEGILTNNDEGREAIKEIGWDNDVNISTQRLPVGGKIKLLMAQAKARSLSDSQSMYPERGDLGFPVNVAPKKTLRKYRCNDSAITDEDVIVLGKYRLNESQAFIYNQFLGMLNGMDPFDVKNLMNDLAYELKETNSLEAFGGIEFSN